MPGSASLLLSALLPVAAQQQEIESWADATHSVRDGLLLWLDASAQPAACAAHGRAAPANDAALGVCYDGSGRGHDLVQRERAAQPRFVRVDDRVYAGALVRFDGVDDVLVGTGLRTQLEDLTLFVHARASSNPGGFRGFVAGNATGRNDYQSGFTVDLSWAPLARFEALNVEGAGFGGARDLLVDAVDFETFHTFTVSVGAGGVTLFLDGKEQGRRERDATPLQVDELCVGARFYSNTSDVPCATGFLDGDIAEVLLYERELAADERVAVEGRLATKWEALDQTLARTLRLRRAPLVAVAPKPVEFMAPGFTARKLPVDLRNVNNVRCRSDGKLVALGYDGDVWLLEDREGDGLEEHAQRFFENKGSLAAPIGMALTPPGYRHGRGLFVACKGKIVLLADRDGDDVAEQEIVVASGWSPAAIPHDVDALGVALAPDGRLFFGLGTSDYTNAYLRIGQDGKAAAHYDLASERGTILEVAPDFSTRRIFCTGIRFPVALAFNGAGELFATDQEGATWLANGNPFDELLHVQEGRHYGFPPRHPVDLPDVIDEPSLFDYGPQHQSICGLCFEPEDFLSDPSRGACFGPPSFQGNALLAGYSRGKLLRTELARARAGWVARTHLLARFDALACDLCLVPGGGLIVATHGGAPDWGSGPTGRGTLWRLDWEDVLPQPLFAFAAAPDEVRVAFDRPLDARRWEGVLDSLAITFGEAVSPADRFEVHRPGYAVVERQLAAPRFDLAVRSVRLLDEQRTLSLRTEPHVLRLPHALQLSENDRSPRSADWDLGYDLCGVAAEWTAQDGGASWSGWLPHFDLAVARAFTAGSRDHDRLWTLLAQPGTLTLRCALDLGDMLRPRLQPGATIDHSWPDEVVTIEVTSGTKLVATRTFQPRGGELEPFELAIETGATVDAGLALDVAWRTAEDARARPLELRRIVLPWAARLRRDTRAPADVAAASDVLPAELAGGNWSRGRAVFFGDDAMCSRCHTLRDGSATFARRRIGPDLSQVWQRDLASLRRDVFSPSAAIHPDHLPYALRLKDGREFVGVSRLEQHPDGSWVTVVGEPGGKETTIAAEDVVSQRALDVSIMPSGLHNVLGERQVTDLLVYLLTRPLAPAPVGIAGAPPPRTLAEIEAATERAPASPLRVVLVAGPKDHGPDEHDYPDWQRRWSRLLALVDGVTVETAEAWPSAAQWNAADVVVHYSANPAWSAADPARAQELDAFLARGGGLVLLHYAVNGRDAVPELARRIGLAWRDGASRFRHGAIDLELAPAARDHEITRSLAAALQASGVKLRFVDESYWNLEGDAAAITVLATSAEEGRAQPQLWTREVGRGRVFVSLLGHYRWTFDDPLFRRLVLRAIAWSARQPADRLAELATVGARFDAE